MKNRGKLMFAARSVASVAVGSWRSTVWTGAEWSPSDNRLQGAIQLFGARLRLRPREPEVLRGIDLDVRPGELVGIAGAEPLAKTMLFSLIRGLIRPTEGVVALDGRSLASYRADFLRRRIGYLSAGVRLFPGTILDNLTLFRRDLEPCAMVAAEVVHVSEAIQTLPQGFRTVVADDRRPLPPDLVLGIAMARALVDDPCLVLFDEADAVGGAAVHRVLAELKGRRTLLVASADPLALRLADRLYTLRDGRLEVGAA